MAIQAQLFSENLGFSLGNSHESLVENGCGFDNFVPQQLVEFQSKNLTLLVDNNNNSSNNNVGFLQQQQQQQSMAFSQSVSAHIERQRWEIEHFINLQNERLKIAMQEQRKQQIAVLIKKYEWKADFLMRQKDEEIARAANRNAELHHLLTRMDAENQTWQRVARENEAMIASLNTSIQRLSENEAGDAESACCENKNESESDAKMEKKSRSMCKCCNSRISCLVMLPCRHLCSCKDCEVFLDSCPVCSMPKKATIEALI